MSNGSYEVSPGDLITSSLWNKLAADLQTALQKLAALDGTGGGTEVVPPLFGNTLGQARSILAQPSVNLNLARVLDALGNVIVPALPAVQGRIVLGQTPPARSRVDPGTGIDLLVSAVSQSNGPGTQLPVIDGFSNPSTAIGDIVVIIGQNFDLTEENNQVTFGGVAADPPTSQSTGSSLFVRVPDGIPGAPTNPGEQLSVDVVVTTEHGSSNSMQHTILPPLSDPVPDIESIDTSPNPTGVVGESLIIHGSNFSESEEDIHVFFNSTSTTPEAASVDQLTVQVPESLPELPTPGSMASFNVVVEINDVRSDPFPLFIQRPANQ